MNDAAGQVVEQATYCKPNDEKRPQRVGLPDATARDICPADVSKGVDELTDAYPDGWYVRIMFDELLDPNIEELTEILDPETGEGTDTFEGSIANTQPVKLECESIGGGFVEVDYDGYYSPSGNNVTWPLGPSLVIKPSEPRAIASGKECRITIRDNVVDKSGETVPSATREFKFKVAPITVIATDPTDSADAAKPAEVNALAPYFDNPYFQFNTDVQASSFCKDADFAGTFANLFLDADSGTGLCDEGTEQFSLTPTVAGGAGGGWGICNVTGDPCDTAADCADPADTHCDSSYVYTYNGKPAGTEFGIGLNTPLKTDTDYTFALKAGAKLKDRCGVETTFSAPTPENLQSIRFHTNKLASAAISPATGDTTPMSKKLTIPFNNVIDPATLDATEFTLTPTPEGFAKGASLSGGDIVLGGNYAPNTEYTFTLNAGAKVADAYGAEYTNATAQTVKWKTQPKIVLSGSSPADKAVVQKLVNQQLVGVTLTFNANMLASSLTAADFTFVNAQGVSVTTLNPFLIGNGSGAAGANCTATSLTCSLRIRADLPPGDYTFTLKAGAQITDKLATPTVYTQETDKVIHFTVKAPVAPIQCL